MPSQKTAKPEVDLINVIAVRTFAVEHTAEEIKNMQLLDKDNKSFKGMTRLINKGESASICKADAKKLQKAGVVQIEL